MHPKKQEQNFCVENHKTHLRRVEDRPCKYRNQCLHIRGARLQGLHPPQTVLQMQQHHCLNTSGCAPGSIYGTPACVCVHACVSVCGQSHYKICIKKASDCQDPLGGGRGGRNRKKKWKRRRKWGSEGGTRGRQRKRKKWMAGRALVHQAPRPMCSCGSDAACC